MMRERSTYYADLHTHNHFSKDSPATPGQVVENCRLRRIDYLAVTNHNTIQGAAETRQIAEEQGFDLVVITGEEITTGILNPAGKAVELLAYFLEETIPGGPDGLTLEETLREIKKQKAILGIPHPFELWRHGAGEEIAKELIARAKEMDIPIFWEIFNSRARKGNNEKSSNFFKTRNNLHRANLLAIAGSDAHNAGEIGRARLGLPIGGQATKEQFLEMLRLSSWWVKKYEGNDRTHITLFYRLLNRFLLFKNRLPPS